MRWQAHSRALIGPVVALGAVGVVVGVRGGEIWGAIGAVAPAALVAAALLHALSLALRAEAWRVALHAVGSAAGGRARLTRVAVHGASAGAFAAGTAVSHVTMPVRVVLLARLARGAAPRRRTVLAADAPIALLEGLFAFGLIGVAAFVGGAHAPLPVWLAPVGVVVVAGLLVALRQAHARFGGGPLGAGLAVLSCRRRRGALAVLVGGLTGLTLLRVWVVLAAFGLPHGFGDAVAVFAAMTVAGLLPLGPAAGPAATLAALGGGDLTLAAAAGLVVSGSSLAGVAAYAAALGLAAAAVATRRRTRRGRTRRITIRRRRRARRRRGRAATAAQPS